MKQKTISPLGVLVRVVRLHLDYWYSLLPITVISLLLLKATNSAVLFVYILALMAWYYFRQMNRYSALRREHRWDDNLRRVYEGLGAQSFVTAMLSALGSFVTLLVFTAPREDGTVPSVMYAWIPLACVLVVAFFVVANAETYKTRFQRMRDWVRDHDDRLNSTADD